MGLRDWIGRLQRPPPEPRTPKRQPTLYELGMSAALLSDERGDDACVGCGFCQTICPTGAIQVEPSTISLSARHGRLRAWPLSFTLDPSRCVACELCMQVCPTDAIRIFRTDRPTGPAVLGLDQLRAQASGVKQARRRSPLGPVPGDEPKAPLVRPTTGAPPSARPATDLNRPRLSAHPTETATSEPTRLESWAHPIDAATDPDSEDIEAIDDPGSWAQFAAVPREPTELQPADIITQPARPEAPDRSGETTDELKVVDPRKRRG